MAIHAAAHVSLFAARLYQMPYAVTDLGAERRGSSIASRLGGGSTNGFDHDHN